jgi:hypothetical protein
MICKAVPHQSEEVCLFPGSEKAAVVVKLSIGSFLGLQCGEDKRVVRIKYVADRNALYKMQVENPGLETLLTSWWLAWAEHLARS